MDTPKKSKEEEYTITEDDLRTVTIGFNGKEILGPAGFGLDPIGLEIGRLWAERQKQKEQEEQKLEDPLRANLNPNTKP